MRLLALLLAVLAVVPAFSETPISDPVSARGAGWQAAPASATNGHDFLLAWIDGRTGYSAIYATRVTADGTALDPEGILIGLDAYGANTPAVAWTGDSYLVVWQSSGCQYRRVGIDGQLGESGSLYDSGSCQSPSVAWSDGTAIIVARRSSEIIVGAIESSGASRILGQLIADSFGVACTQSDCMLAWLEDGMVWGRSIGRHGERFDSPRRLLASEAMELSIAATEDRFLLAWREQNGLDWAATRIRARELNAESSSPIFTVIERTKRSFLNVNASASGDGFIVAWNQFREGNPRPSVRSETVASIPSRPQVQFSGKRIGDGESDLLFAATDVEDNNRKFTIASNGTTHLGSWIERSSHKITAAVAQDAELASHVEVTKSARGQSEGQVVNCGDHLLVVWAEEVRGDGSHSVFARRFSLDGTALDANPIAIADEGSQHLPVAAFDGHSYLVAWIASDFRVYARVLNRNGVPAPQVLSLSTNRGGGNAPAVTATDRGFAVLHDDSWNGLLLTSITSDSVAKRTTIARSTRDYALGWDGEHLVAVWDEYDGLRTAFMSSDGTVIGTLPLLRDSRQASLPDITCDTAECVIVWENYRDLAGIVSIKRNTFFAETVRDLAISMGYRERHRPRVVRATDGFHVLSDDYSQWYEKQVIAGLAVNERPVLDLHGGRTAESFAFTPDGLVVLSSRPVYEAGYAGARRLFLQQLPR